MLIRFSQTAPCAYLHAMQAVQSMRHATYSCGGEYPLHGRLRLRSFHEVVTFIGRGIEEEPEVDVPPDPRTPAITENPVRTLEIVEARESPPGADLSVQWRGYHYAVREQSGYQWNKKAFSLLYQLFQMSMSPVGATGPAITIAK